MVSSNGITTKMTLFQKKEKKPTQIQRQNFAVSFRKEKQFLTFNEDICSFPLKSYKIYIISRLNIKM